MTTQSESGSWGIEPTQKHTPWYPTDASISNEKEKVIYVPWYQTRNSINNKKVHGMFIPAWHPVINPGTEEHETSYELQGWGANSVGKTQRIFVSPKYRNIGIVAVDSDKMTAPVGKQTYIKDVTTPSIGRKEVFESWKTSTSNFANSNPKTVFVDMMASKHHRDFAVSKEDAQILFLIDAV